MAHNITGQNIQGRGGAAAEGHYLEAKETSALRQAPKWVKLRRCRTAPHWSRAVSNLISFRQGSEWDGRCPVSRGSPRRQISGPCPPQHLHPPSLSLPLNYAFTLWNESCPGFAFLPRNTINMQRIGVRRTCPKLETCFALHHSSP